MTSAPGPARARLTVSDRMTVRVDAAVKVMPVITKKGSRIRRLSPRTPMTMPMSMTHAPWTPHTSRPRIKFLPSDSSMCGGVSRCHAHYEYQIFLFSS